MRTPLIIPQQAAKRDFPRCSLTAAAKADSAKAAHRSGKPLRHPKSSATPDFFRSLLGKFIYHPVVLASLGHDYFGRSAGDMRASKRDQYNWENVAALMPMAARDLEGVLCSARKKLFQCVGILRVADAVAEQDHSVFEISGLPRVHEVVSGSQGEYLAGFGGGFLLGWMAVRSGPDWGRQQGKTNCQQDLHAKAGPHCLR
jgi:hypothetical protein